METTQRSRPMLAGLAPFARPSSFLLVVALVATLAGKAIALMQGGASPPFALEFASTVALDFAVYGLLVALFAAGERVRPWVAALTVPLSIIALFVALVNAGYLVIANDQVDSRMLEVGLRRFGEVAGILLLQATRGAGPYVVALVVAIPIAHIAAKRAFVRAEPDPRRLDTLRVRVGLSLLAVGLLAFGASFAVRRPRSLGARMIAENALVHSYATYARGAGDDRRATTAELARHFDAPLITRAGAAHVAASPELPSVLLIVLESTRYDHVQLPISGHRAHVRTPNLLALARRGLVFTNVHATMPHTSKSLFSMLCGRLPSMETAVLEANDAYSPSCLPAGLRTAGYATAFFQSALGTFEGRPRFVERMGYRDFLAFETLGAAPLGYLAGDDRAIAPAFARWLDAMPAGGRFFGTVLTSGTHHPYDVPDDVPGATSANVRERYAAAVAVEDALVGSLVAELERRGRLASTLIVTVADHGEGLPGDPVHQHDNDFFATSIHVPMIVAGPGIPTARVDRLLSLMDVGPTVLGVLGLRSQLPDEPLRFGIDASHAERPRVEAPFACWHDGVCLGVVRERDKLVDMPSDRRTWVVTRDVPGAPAARDATEDERRGLARLRDVVRSTRLSSRDVPMRELRDSWGFRCRENSTECRHATRPAGGFH